MKSFYILPYIEIYANVFFDTLKEAKQFAENAKLDSNYVFANMQGIQQGSRFVVSVKMEVFKSTSTYLVTLADEDLVETVNNYFGTNPWPNFAEQDNFEVYDEVPMVRCFVQCDECGANFEMNLTNGEFASMLYRNVIENETDDFKFMCNDCYFRNNYFSRNFNE